MSEVCDPGFSAAQRGTSAFKPKGNTPQAFAEGKAGHSDFLVWASLPKMTYSASPESLYDMKKVKQLMENSECFTQEEIDRQAKAGVEYPRTFYIGLAMGGLAVLYTLFRSK
jgi:hypothetical protein